MIRKPGRSALRFSDPNMPVLDINDRFVDACANGDYQTVIKIIEAIKDFNIDVTDNLGRTALRLAVANEHIEVVQSLLSKSDSQKLREALLLAIFMGHTPIAECILRHPQYKIFNDKKFLNGATDSFWQTPSSDDAQFSPDITPIMLASQYNRTEIVQMLLLNGDRIEKPHDFHCKCNECSNRFKFDSLRHAQSRLNAYRGLASEAYISLASIDPILTAFELGRELKILSEKEKYFKSEYLDLAEKLSEFTVKLLSNVRGRDELEIVLNKMGKENEEKFQLFARLELALKYQEMPFVAHPNCQQKLVEIWYTGIRRITKMNQAASFCLLLCFILWIPFGCIAYIFAPNSKVGRFMSLPCIKFVTLMTSYLCFVAMIVYASLQFATDQQSTVSFASLFPMYVSNFTQYTSNEELKYRFEAPNFFIRKTTANNLDIIIIIWLLGFIVNECKQLYTYGIKDYLLSMSNIVNVCMLTLYVVAYGLKFYTMIIVKLQLNKLYDSHFWATVSHLEGNEDAQIDVYETFYWLNDDRFYWFSLDPINLSEALFAIATIFTFSKLAFFLPANQNLGPLQITLGRMIGDVLKFIVIFLIIFVGFLFALNNLYWYYQSSVRNTVEVVEHFNEEANSTLINAELFFGTIPLTFQTMFWSIFLIGNGEAVIIYPFDNQLTLVFGYLIVGMFHISNITVLLNMLIAMMTRSYETILHHSDTEWKFSRSKLYMEFIRDSATLPVPFNIIPMPVVCYNVVKSLKNRIVKGPASHSNEIEMPAIKANGTGGRKMGGTMSVIDETNARPNGHANSDRSKEKRRSIGGNVLTYQKVMERVVKRFLLHNNRENEDIRESDFDEIKQDIQMIRFEMITDLRRVREDQLRYVSLLHNGMSLLGEFMVSGAERPEEGAELHRSLLNYRSHERSFLEEMDDIMNLNKQIGIVTRQNTTNDLMSNGTLPNASATAKKSADEEAKPATTNSSDTVDTNDIGQGADSDLDLRSPSENQMTTDTVDLNDLDKRPTDSPPTEPSNNVATSYSDLNIIKNEAD